MSQRNHVLWTTAWTSQLFKGALDGYVGRLREVAPGVHVLCFDLRRPIATVRVLLGLDELLAELATATAAEQSLWVLFGREAIGPAGAALARRAPVPVGTWREDDVAALINAANPMDRGEVTA